ncbi:MAG: hypothetical protein J6J35_00560 [Alphaproteobacteria bacterium]|nr:hypothetical protein [Alphaproteobacteria bacterium]
MDAKQTEKMIESMRERQEKELAANKNKSVDVSSFMSFTENLKSSNYSFKDSSDLKSYVKGGIGRDFPEAAVVAVCDFMKNSPYLKGDGVSTSGTSADYSFSAVTSDLCQTLASIQPATPEISVLMLETAMKLNSDRDAFLERQGIEYECKPELRLREYNKMGKYFGDEKVAKAYWAATLPEIEKMGLADYKGIVGLETRMRFEEIAKLHPELAGVVKVHQLSSEERAFCEKLREGEQSKADTHSSKKMRNFDFKNVKDKAKTFVAGSKAYAAGKDLFKRVKDETVKAWNNPKNVVKDVFVENMRVLKENPRKYTVGGVAAMFVGFETLNPPFVAAGAAIMTAGAMQWAASKVKEKIAPKKGDEEKSFKIPGEHGLNNVVLGKSYKEGR